MESLVHGVEIFQQNELTNERVKAWQQEMISKSEGKFEIVQICLSGDSPTLAIHYKVMVEPKSIEPTSSRRASRSNIESNVLAIGGGLRKNR